MRIYRFSGPYPAPFQTFHDTFDYLYKLHKLKGTITQQLELHELTELFILPEGLEMQHQFDLLHRDRKSVV